VRAWLDAGHSTNSDDAPNFEAVARSWLKQREALELALKFMESVNLAGATEKEYQAALSKINALLEDGK